MTDGKPASTLQPVRLGPLLRTPRKRAYCPVALPWFRFMHQDDPLSLLRGEVYAWNIRNRRGLTSALRKLRFGLTWPLLSIAKSWRALRQWGSWARDLDGGSLPLQLAQMVWLANSRNITAQSYYLFGLWRKPARARVDQWIQGFEGWWINGRIHEHVDIDTVDDKIEFFHACGRLGLPTIPIVVTIAADGAVQWLGGASALPEEDLFVKPADGTIGSGIERWICDPMGSLWQRDGESLTGEQLLADLAARHKGRRLLVQRRVHNAKALQPLSQGSLSTYRVMTGRAAGGPACWIGACLRMGIGEAIVDNYTAGGIAAGVTSDGRICAARGMYVAEALDTHPVTGHRFLDTELPGWQAMNTLALRAHDAFATPGLVSWDIALTDNGPLLVEGNCNGSYEVIESAYDEPLGCNPVLLSIITTARGAGNQNSSE